MNGETRVYSDYERKLKELEVMHGVAKLLSSKTDLKEMLKDILELLSREMGMSRGMITLLLREFHEAQLDIAPGMDDEAIQKIRYGVGEGVTGQVVATGRPMAIPKLDEAPLFLDRTGARKEVDRSRLAFICVPIKHGDDVVGALSVDTVAVEKLDLDDEVKFLGAVADMIARSVEVRREEEEARERLERENLRLRKQLEQVSHPENIVGNSKGMQEVYMLISQVSDTGTTVLITGETGTGKELVASAIHYASPRRNGPFVRVNCAALPETLLENELFGHEKGAFTGASGRYAGRFEAANGGTIFLDEIGDLSLSAQVRLLRILQEKEFERIGGLSPVRVNVRVIAATNRNLEESVLNGQFRVDLFYRLNVFPIHVPPLRERGADIMLLADYFVQKYSGELGKKITRICSPAIDALMSYHWPGNVRELENCIERAVLLSSDGVIHAHNLPPSLQLKSRGVEAVRGGSLEKLVAAYERELIEEALKYTGGNQSQAARQLGTTKRIIQYKVKKYGIDCSWYKEKKPWVSSRAAEEPPD
ncbi:MAG: sigma 54-interacting transcriptional regulator [bacterium]